MEWRPAFSAAFAPEAVVSIPGLLPLERLTADWAWGNSTGRGVRVAVVDSGIDSAHPAIGGSVSGYVTLTGDGEEVRFDLSQHGDTHGHGTACAGIIRSIAPDAELYSVKVLTAGVTGRGNVFAAGLRWAIANDMQVCNLSLGTTKRDYYAVLHELADQAYFRNVMLVTAANNAPTPSFPSLYPSVISVAAHEVQDPYLFYYNPTPPVEFGALGINVRVAWRDGGWLTASGNSFAAPHIAGLVARILAKHPGLTVFQVKGILHALSANVSRAGRAELGVVQ